MALACTAFRSRSEPYRARRQPGSVCRAKTGSLGPASSCQAPTAPMRRRASPHTGPEVRKRSRSGK